MCSYKWVYNSATFALDCCDSWWSGIDGLIWDISNNNDAIGILRIVCPMSLRISDIEDILSDTNFFIEENEGVLVLKKGSSWRTFHKFSITNRSLWSKFCDTAVFVFNGMIIMRIYFKKDVFLELILKINSFYKKFLLPKLAMDFKAKKGITKV